jgi:hypothetical protein
MQYDASMRCRVGSFLLASSLLLGCTPKVTTAAPTCPEVPEPLVVADPPVPPAPVVTETPEPPPEPDEQLVTEEFNDVTITVRVDEKEPDVAHVRVEVAHEGVDTVDVVERDIDPDGCLVSEVGPTIDIILGDDEFVVFEASFQCVRGAEFMHVTGEHLVMATWANEPGLAVLYEGTSLYINNRKLAVSLDKREFYVEAGELAVYRHTVEWCDDESMKILRGEDGGCGRDSPRRLKLLKRVPISVPRVP